MPKYLNSDASPMEISLTLGENILELAQTLATDLAAARAEALAWRRFAEWHPVSEKPEEFPCDIEIITPQADPQRLRLYHIETDADFSARVFGKRMWRYFNAHGGWNG